MDVVVKKFGGTSVANTERIKRVAKIISSSSEKSIVVVSAMAGVTNQLVAYTHDVGPIIDPAALAEYDTVISAGEQITIGLLSLALISIGIKSKSYLGWQVPIITTSDFSQAKIIEIKTDEIINDLENGVVPIIAGFQGSYRSRITTLGRGGSDTTAVAIAAAIRAMRCDIYTDVDGIFTADPRIVPKAKKIDTIDYKSVLEMASCGAKVIHPRAVEIGMISKVPIRILNTFSNDPGTEIKEEMEKIAISGIALKNNLVMITISRVKDIDIILQEIISLGVIIDSVSQGSLHLENGEIKYDYTIITSNEYVDRCTSLVGYDIMLKDKINKISVIGIGVKSIIGEILKVAGSVISLQVLETQVSFLIDQVHTDKVVRDLHTTLGLDA